MASEPVSIDVKAWLEEARFGAYQKFLLALCFLTLLLDGFDAQVIAVAAPGLTAHLGLEPAELGALFAGGTLGGAVAGFLIAPFSNRLGRRVLIAGSLGLSGVLTLGYLVAATLPQLLALRIGCGFLLAVAVSVTFSYAAEITPRRMAVRGVMFTTTGFGIGVAMSGFIGAWMIPAFGWQSVFITGGVLTIIASVLLVFLLPESARYMAYRGGQNARLREVLKRIDPGREMPDGAIFVLNEEQKPGLALTHILGSGRAGPVMMLWAVGFLVNVNIWILVQWLPTFVREAGADISQASVAVGWFKMGGIVGGLICAYFVDRARNGYPLLTVVAVACAASFLLLAEIDAKTTAFLFAVVLTGMLIHAVSYTNGGLLARMLPTYVRMPGMAISGGFSRLGSMTGPLGVGLLKQVGWSNAMIFKAALIPLLLCAVLFVLLAVFTVRLREREESSGEGAPAVA
ncbi:MAG TPA: MFS transporter [Caulobacteraceae bacterium]|nr:MFS transporter [Caulobacteraceae bacterium]